MLGIGQGFHAYHAHSIRVGASIQEQLNHLQMSPKSGEDKGSSSILRETDTVSESAFIIGIQQNMTTSRNSLKLSNITLSLALCGGQVRLSVDA